jgi:hypothetical protein
MSEYAQKIVVINSPMSLSFHMLHSRSARFLATLLAIADDVIE